MPTFKAVALSRRKSGERSVYIRMTHNRRHRHLPTGLTATDRDVRGSELVSALLIDKTNEIMKEMRDRCNALGASLLTTDIDTLARLATRRDGFDGDFLAYCDRHLERLGREGREGTLIMHRTVVASLRRYTGGRLTFDEIDKAFLEGWKGHLRTLGRRAPSAYFGVVAAIHREARAELNDPDTGIVRIPRDPFAAVKPDKAPTTRKKALTVDEMRSIRDLPDGRCTGLMRLARDMFMLSFYLMGINGADLYELGRPVDGVVSYERRKTRTRRADRAHMEVRVQPEAAPLLERYADRHGDRALDLHNLYLSARALDGAVSKGMRAIGEALGIGGLTYYAARHTWATWAANDCGVDIYVVEKALCHKPAGLGVTETYIKPDYRRTDNANRLVLDMLAEGDL